MSNVTSGPRLRYRRGVRAALINNFEAGARARQLLLDHLSPEQCHEFKLVGYFYSIGSESKGRYMVCSDIVIRMADSHRFCLVVMDGVPVEDLMLARKLLIECNEPLFLATANDLSDPLVRVARQVRLDEVNQILARLNRPNVPRRLRRPPEPPTPRRTFFQRLRQW